MHIKSALHKFNLSLLLFCLCFLSCSPQESNSQKKSNDTSTLSNIDKINLDSLKFDYKVLDLLNTHSKKAKDYYLRTYESFDEDFEPTVQRCLSMRCPERQARELVFNLKDNFTDMGYMIYISETNFGYELDEVSILKSEDQFDIIRSECTSGYNYDIDNAMVVEKLKEWFLDTPFIIMGADVDWVEAILINKPKNVKAFAKEQYDFCPDIVTQGTGTLKALEKSIMEEGTLFLWWD